MQFHLVKLCLWKDVISLIGYLTFSRTYWHTWRFWHTIFLITIMLTERFAHSFREKLRLLLALLLATWSRFVTKFCREDVWSWFFKTKKQFKIECHTKSFMNVTALNIIVENMEVLLIQTVTFVITIDKMFLICIGVY